MVYFSDLFQWFISRETIIFQVSSGDGGFPTFSLDGVQLFLCKPINL